MPPQHIPNEIIIDILDIIKQTSPTPWLDLLSCSLISQSWHQCAFPSLRAVLQDLDMKGLSLHDLKIRDLHQIIHCITEANMLKTQVDDFLNQLEWSPNYMLDYKPKEGVADSSKGFVDQFYAAAILDLLQSLRGCTHLKLDFCTVAGNRGYADAWNYCYAAVVPFFSQIVPHFRTTLTHLTLTGRCQFTLSIKTATSAADDPLAQLLSTLVNLQEFVVMDFELTDPIVRALAHCPSLQTVILKHVNCVSIPLLATSLVSCPNLRHLTLSIFHPSSFVPIISTFLATNPPLETLYLRQTLNSPADDFSDLLGRLIPHVGRHLTRLTLWGAHYLDDTVLAALARSAPRLTHLNLVHCARLTGRGVGRPDWPALKVLELASCKAIEASFVREVVRTCKGTITVCAIPEKFAEDEGVKEAFAGEPMHTGGAGTGIVHWVREGYTVLDMNR
ncbi:hypothetical protein BC936DRAFT_147783 [Jimgerdemannia flammicorona]|uniref:F-box domain-containing protein n=1 Tax=Jimgerdemannia flammicorona TaxID=994334 RepID=A0A433D4P3_9FUNG|nr:hypothetical protein BC936DRAFT_147783 [Jimgerdemannia flammicorona]